MAAILTNIANSVFEASTNTHQNSLDQFLNKFSRSQKLIDQIQPLATFEVFMKFHPTIEIGTIKEEQNVTKSNLVKNLLNNVSGGLYNSIFEKEEELKYDFEKDDFKTVKENHNRDHTFIEYLAKANLLVGNENYGGDKKQLITPLELRLGFYVQSITIPKIKIMDEKSNTYLGDFLLNIGSVIPDNNTITMDILCTKLPLHERIFYPWMREVTLPFWSYDIQPFTTATITVDFSKHTDIQYVFTGCRPTQIDAIQPTQEINSNLTRQVTFAFDYMFITSKNLPVVSSKKNDNERLIASGKTLFNTANKFI